MARHRTPTNILELRGSFVKNPQRKLARVNEPKVSEGLGLPPTFLTKDQRAAWLEIERIAPYGVLTQADRIIVEIAAVLLAALREAGGMMQGGKFARLESLLARMGLSPADRSKVNAVSKPKINEFAKFGKPPRYDN